MSKNRNRKITPEYGELAQAQDIPEDILASAERFRARAGNQTTLDLKPKTYRERQSLSVAGSIVRIATLGDAKPTFNAKQHELFFAVASLFGRTARIQTHRFDLNDNRLKPLEVCTKAVDKEGYLLYVPARSILYSSKDGQMSAKAFTHPGVQWAEEKVVSFVTSDRNEVHNERAFMAATEIAQNRLAVKAVKPESGKVHDTWQAYEPYQESIANGLGNMLGSVAIGSNYRQYESYIHGVYRQRPMWGNTLPRTLLSSGFRLVSPHIMFNQQTYEQVADGEIPLIVPEIIPVNPMPTRR